MTYYQIRVKKKDKLAKTALTCTKSHYEFLVMIFGLTNTPVTFGKEEVGYLGFVVGKRQVKTDLEKMKTVSK
jgi:hypothetical protein